MAVVRIMTPRESGKFIAESARHVSIDDEGVKNLAQTVLENMRMGTISIKKFSQHPLHPTPDDPNALDWIFVLDTLNFSFWTDDSKLPKKWKVNGETGYFALCAAIKRALEEGIPITDAEYLSTVTQEQVSHILRPDEDCLEIPMMDKRVENLNEIGKVLLEKYKGTFKKCVKASKNSAEKLVKTVVADFPCFNDIAVYKNRLVSFHKRAQILVGDIWACYEGKGHGTFNDINYITMFADYRVPQVLEHFGVLRYSESLSDKLFDGYISDEELRHASDEEIEIRGCSIEAVERVVQETRRLIRNDPSLNLQKSDCNCILVDHYLWDYRRKNPHVFDKKPYHKTRTIFY